MYKRACVRFIPDFLRARIRDLPGLILCCRRRTRAAVERNSHNPIYIYICMCVFNKYCEGKK